MTGNSFAPFNTPAHFFLSLFDQHNYNFIIFPGQLLYNHHHPHHLSLVFVVVFVDVDDDGPCYIDADDQLFIKFSF